MNSLSHLASEKAYLEAQMNSNRIFLAGIFLIALYWVTKLYWPFLIDITIASLLALAMYSIQLFFSKYISNRILTSFLTTLILCIIFIAPIAYVIVYVAKLQTNFNFGFLESTVNYIKNIQHLIPESLNFAKPYIEDLLKNLDTSVVTTKIVYIATSIGKLGVTFFKDAILIIIFFFFAMLYGKTIAEYIKNVLPMNNNEVETLFFEIANVMSVVFYSIILNAALQGILFAIIATIFGYDGLLLGIIYGIASLIPIVGGALVWVPLSVIELSNGNIFNAIIIGVYTVLTISIIADTFIKPYVIKWINKKLVRIPTNINELLIFFAMIAGLSTFGFWGIIIGPAITTFFLSILRLYKAIKDGDVKTIDKNINSDS